AHQFEGTGIDGEVTPVRGDMPVEQHCPCHDVSLASADPMTAPTADQLRSDSVHAAAASTRDSVAVECSMTALSASARASTSPLGTTRPRSPYPAISARAG